MLKFEEGQTYICTHSEVDWWTVGKEYSVFTTSFGIKSIKDDIGMIWHDDGDNDDDDEIELSNTNFKLKEEPQTVESKEVPFTPTIEIDFLIDYIESNHLGSNEIISFLKGHKKGQVFIHETLN